MRLPFGDTITVIRPAEIDEVGDPTGPSTTFTVDECVVAWQSSRVGESSVFEDTDRRETTTMRANLYTPRTADIRATDRIELPNGNHYNIVGLPEWDQVHPMNGWNPNYKIYRIEGIF